MVTTFDSGLVGWAANTITQDGQANTVFSNGSRPVAGLAPRPTAKANRPSRWIGNIAGTEVAATLMLVTKASGQVRATAVSELWRIKNEWTHKKLEVAAQAGLTAEQRQAMHASLAEQTRARVTSLLGAEVLSAGTEALQWLPAGR